MKMKSEKLSINNLKVICQKNDDEIFITDKLIFRKLSIYVTKVCILLKISANCATFLSLIFALLGSILLLSNDSTLLILASICIFMYWVLDYVDGELARYYIHMNKQKKSLQGSYFDYLVHFFSTNIMFLAIGYSSYKRYDDVIFYLLGIISCIGISNFPNLVASMIIAKDINYNKNNIIQDDEKNILLLLDDGARGKENILNDNKLDKVIQFIKEALVFPGCLNMIIIVTLMDGISNNSINILGLNVRSIYLILFSIIMLLNTIRKSVFWINRMKDVS